MGRTRLSATTLHSILHEKTREAAPHVGKLNHSPRLFLLCMHMYYHGLILFTLNNTVHLKDLESETEIIRKTYWALVIGSPRRSEGLISLPLQKVR